jgi:hypothetical protein
MMDGCWPVYKAENREKPVNELDVQASVATGDAIGTAAGNNL